MSSVSVTQEISAAPEVVWSIVVGMDDWVETIQAIEKVERLDDGDGFLLGTTWRETRTMFKKTATEDMEVTEFKDGVSYATAAESHGSKYFSEISVAPTDRGSRLTMAFRGEPQTTFTKIMDVTVGRLFMGATRKAFAKDLADIAAAAEAAS
jgi:Polyketide cyclase / dehydrase and lipid transport